MTYRTILAMLYRRKLVILGFFICALAGGYAGLKIVQPAYRATAQVLLNLGQDDVFMPVLPSSSSEVRTPLTAGRVETRANSEIRIIESEQLAAQVVKKFGPAGLFPGIDERHPWYTPKGLMQRAVDVYRAIGHYLYPQSAGDTLEDRARRRLMQNTKTQTVKDSTVIQITVDSAVPEIAAAAANELVGLYLHERSALYQGANTAFFGAQLSKLMGELETIDRQIETFRDDNKIIDVEMQREAVMKRLAEVKANVQNETVVTGEIRRRIGILERQIGEGSQIASISSLQRIRDDLLRSQAELGPHQESLANWTRIQNELTAQAEALTRKQSESVRLLQQQKVLQDTRRLYLQKVEEARVQQALRQAQIGDAAVINWAIVDYSPVSPKLGMVLGGIVGVGLLGGIGLALLLGFMDDRILREEDVADATGLPVIGQVPEMPRAAIRSS